MSAGERRIQVRVIGRREVYNSGEVISLPEQKARAWEHKGWAEVIRVLPPKELKVPGGVRPDPGPSAKTAPPKRQPQAKATNLDDESDAEPGLEDEPDHDKAQGLGGPHANDPAPLSPSELVGAEKRVHGPGAVRAAVGRLFGHGPGKDGQAPDTEA